MKQDALRYFKGQEVVQESSSHLADHIWYPLCDKWKFIFAVTVAGSEASPEVHRDFTKYLKYPVNNNYIYSEVSGWKGKA